MSIYCQSISLTILLLRAMLYLLFFERSEVMISQLYHGQYRGRVVYVVRRSTPLLLKRFTYSVIVEVTHEFRPRSSDGFVHHGEDTWLDYEMKGRCVEVPIGRHRSHGDGLTKTPIQAGSLMEFESHYVSSGSLSGGGWTEYRPLSWTSGPQTGVIRGVYTRRRIGFAGEKRGLGYWSLSIQIPGRDDCLISSRVALPKKISPKVGDVVEFHQADYPHMDYIRMSDGRWYGIW